MTTRAAVAVSDVPDDRAAGADAARAASDLVGEVLRQRLALLVVSGGRNLATVSQGLREILGSVPMVGLSAPALFTNESSTTSGVGLLLLASSHTRITTAAASGWKTHPARALGHLFGELRRQRGGVAQQYLARSLLVLADAPPETGQDLVDGISIEEGLRFDLFGATTTPRSAVSHPLLHGEDLLRDSVVAVEILADRCVSIALAAGYTFETRIHRVTNASGRRINKVDGLEAATFWSHDSPGRGALATIGPDGQTRLLGGVVPGSGGVLECPMTVPSGTLIQFARLETNPFAEACRQAVEEARATLTSGVGPAALLVLAAKAKQPGGRLERGEEAMGKAAGDVPLLGIEGSGAIARRQGRIHAYHTASHVVCALPGE